MDLRLPASSRPGVPVLRRSGPVDAASNPPPGQTGPAGDPGTVQARSAIATWSRQPAPVSGASDEQAGRLLTADGMLAGILLQIGLRLADPQRTHGPGARSMHSSMVGRPMTTQATCMAARVSRSGSGSWRPPGQVGVGLLAGVLVGNVVEGRGAAQPFIVNVRPRDGGRPAGRNRLGPGGRDNARHRGGRRQPGLIGAPRRWLGAVLTVVWVSTSLSLPPCQQHGRRRGRIHRRAAR